MFLALARLRTLFRTRVFPLEVEVWERSRLEGIGVVDG